MIPLDTLRHRLAGCVIGAGDRDYDAARAVWNAAIDRRPLAIVRCASVTDVCEALRFATANDLRVTVRGGGHSVAGRPIQPDVLVVDLTGMRSVKVNAAQRSATVAGGATWRDVDAAAAAFWLGTTGGMVSTTGVGGMTLGGGIGWLMRKYGLAIDNLHGAEVALATGELLLVDEQQHEELYWAVRGGGGIPGVVTAFTFALHPVSMVLAGSLWFPAEQAGKLLRTLRPLLADAPDELTCIVTATGTPPAPFLPPAMHGKPAVVLGVCWCGDLEAGRQTLATVRSLEGVFADLIEAQSYPALQSSLDMTAPSGMRHYWRNLSVPRLTDAVIDLFAQQAMTLPTPFTLIHLHQLGGAVARSQRDLPTSVLRDQEFILNIAAACLAPQDEARMTDWVRDYARKLEPHCGIQSYINFEAKIERVPNATFSEASRARLAALWARYDPAGVFLKPR